MKQELPDFIAWEIYYKWLDEMGIIADLNLSNEEIESLIKFAYRKGWDEHKGND